MVPDVDPLLSLPTHFIENRYAMWAYLAFLTYYRFRKHSNQEVRLKRLESLITSPMEYKQARFFQVGRPVAKPEYIVIHHLGTGTIDSAINTFQSPSVRASAHYILGEGRAVQLVNERDTAWASNNGYIDPRAICIELYDTIDHPISEVTYAQAANLVHDIALRYALPLDRAHVFGHKEVARPTEPTACPGRVSVDRIVSDARSVRYTTVDYANVNPFLPVFHPGITVVPSNQVTKEMLMAGELIQFEGDPTVYVIIGSFAGAFGSEADLKKSYGEDVWGKVTHLPSTMHFRPLNEIH